MDESKKTVNEPVGEPSVFNVGLGELLPCPFCGSKPTRRIINDILKIDCPSCISVGFHNHVRFGCRADEEWNTRAPNVI